MSKLTPEPVLFGCIDDNKLYYTTISSYYSVQDESNDLSTDRLQDLYYVVDTVKNNDLYQLAGPLVLKFLCSLGAYEYLPNLITEAERVRKPVEHGSGLVDVLDLSDYDMLDFSQFLKNRYPTAVVKYKTAWWVFDGENFNNIRYFQTPQEKFKHQLMQFAKGGCSLNSRSEYQDWVNMLETAEDQGYSVRCKLFTSSEGQQTTEHLDNLEDIIKAIQPNESYPMLVFTSVAEEQCYDAYTEVLECTVVQKAFLV